MAEEKWTNDELIVKTETCYDILSSWVGACTRMAIAEGRKPSDEDFRLSWLYKELNEEARKVLYSGTEEITKEGFALVDRARPYLIGYI